MIAGEEGDSVFIANSAPVPIVWDLLLAFVIDEGAGLAGNTVEGFEDVAGEVAFGIGGGFVGHEAVDECVCCGLHQYSREGSVEEVGVLVDGLLEALGSERGESGEIVAVGAEWLGVHVLKLGQDDFVVVVVLVQVRHRRAGIRLVLVVAPNEPLRGSEETKGV